MNFENELINEQNNLYGKWDRTEKGLYKPTYNNTLNFIESLKPSIKYNQFSSVVEFDSHHYSDDDSIFLKEKMRTLKLEPSMQTIDEAVKTYAMRYKYNPVTDYLNNLVWDKTPRLAKWLSVIGSTEDSEYTRFVSTLIFVSAVKRAFEPGCQCDHMPIIEGKQGIYKSRAIRVIGGAWYKEISLMDKDKDTIHNMQGAWIIEVPELAAFTKKDINSLKAFITISEDSARLSYARNVQKFPRRSIFIGTINPEANGYLMDKTGNRRFLPVTVKQIDVDALHRFRDQLFAEAVCLYKEGWKIYIDSDRLAAMARKEQHEREEKDEWCGLVMQWIKDTFFNENEYKTLFEIYNGAIGGTKDRYDQATSRRMGNVMRMIGVIPPKVSKRNGIVAVYYNISAIKQRLFIHEVNEKSDLTVEF